MDFEDSPFARLAFDRNFTAVILDDPLADGEAQPYSSSFLRRKKRLKNLGKIRFRDAKAGVRHRYHRHRRSAIELRYVCFYNQLAAFRHSVNGVQKKIDQNLLQLLGIGLDARQIRL